MLSLSQLKSLYKEGIDYAKNKAPWFFPPIEDAISQQLQLVQKAPDLTTFMAAVNLSNPTFQGAFDTPVPIPQNNLLSTTPPQWGSGAFGWYFFVGNFGLTDDPISYCFTFFRCEVAPPGAVTLKNRGNAVAWFIGGGYGKNEQDWVTVPYEYIQMNYTPLTYSTFTLEGKGEKYIGDCYLKTTEPFVFTFNINFTDLDGNSHSVQSVSQSLVPPQQAGDRGYISYGFPGLASLYWSYTDMDVTAVIDGKTYYGGKGWMDHQTMKIAGVKAFVPGSTVNHQALFTVLKTISGPANNQGWTWNMIQDLESGIQYMIATRLPKGYHDNPSSFQPGLKLKETICNMYKDGAPYIKPEGCKDLVIEISKVQVANGHSYPLEINFTLPGGKKVISRTVSGLNLFTNNAAQISCESPGILYDESGQKQIGYSLLELNGPLTRSEVITKALKLSGGDPSSQTQVSILNKAATGYQPTSRKIVAFLIVFMPLILLVVFIWLIFHSKKGRWDRFGLVVVVILLLEIVMVTIAKIGSRNKNIIKNSSP